MRRNSTLLTLVALSVVLHIVSTAAAQELIWSRNYGGSRPDGAYAIEATPDGGFIATGFTESFAESGLTDVYLVKTDGLGQQEWSQTYDGLGDRDEFGAAVLPLPDGGYLIAGRLQISRQTFDSLLIRTDRDGNLLWQRTYDAGIGADDRAHAVALASDGGFIVGGQAWFPEREFSNYDLYLFKTDSNGNVEWQSVFEHDDGYIDGPDIAFSVTEVSTGGYLVAGYTSSSVWDGWVVRTDEGGNMLWERTYGDNGGFSDELTSVKEVSTGGFIFTGVKASPRGDTDLWLLRTADDGEVLWQKTFGSNQGVQAEDDGRCVLELADGGFVVAGHTSSFGAGGWDMYIIRTDESGNNLWTSVYGGPSDDRAHGIAATVGGVVAAGWAWSFGNGAGDLHLAKFADPFSQLQCDAIRKFSAKCGAGKLTVKIASSLPEGTRLTVSRDGGDMKTTTISARGKGKVRYDVPAGRYTLSIVECPDIERKASCP